MTIDVLSYAGFTPIIVGDSVDMTDLQAVGRDEDSHFHLVMDGQKVPLSSEANINFATAKHLLVVSLSPSDQITAARKVRLDDLDDGQELSADQRDALAKALSLGQGSERKFYTEALAEFRRTYPDLAA